MADEASERTLTLKLPQIGIEQLLETLFAHAPRNNEYIESVNCEVDPRTNGVMVTVKLILPTWSAQSTRG
jgi:hypothetical protein